MTQNLSRRDLLKQAAIVLPVGAAFMVASGCPKPGSPEAISQSDTLISYFNRIATAAQLTVPALEIGAQFLPPPYNVTIPAVLPLFSTFVNVANTAVSQSVAELASADISADKVRKVFGYFGQAFLDPSVLASLPSVLKNTAGQPVSTGQLITALVKDINDALAASAHMVGGTTQPVAGNVINAVVLPVAVPQAVVASMMTMTPAQIDQLNTIGATTVVTKMALVTVAQPKPQSELRMPTNSELAHCYTNDMGMICTHGTITPASF